ncbi:MAG: hypothetical protein HY666_05475 [Chloroflexi bacterium]|nr:hypothetical protein [Chloroflexota bacterium]
MLNERGRHEESQKVAEQVHKGVKVYSAGQSHFLSRLRGLKAKREEYLKTLPVDPRLLRLLDNIVYSTYMDCVHLGMEEEAKVILSGEESRI